MTARGVLAVGDVIDDVIVRPHSAIEPDTDTPSSIERVAGGSAANTACWLAAEGTRATLVATVGAEDLDRHAALLQAHGVTPRLTGSPKATGTIVVISSGEYRAMLTDRGANADTSPAAVDDTLLEAHAILFVAAHVFTGEDRDAAWRDLFLRAEDAGTTTVVAPGSVSLLAGFGSDRFRALVAGVDVLCAGIDEARLLTGHADPVAAGLALAADHPLVAVTLGRHGSLLVRGDRVRRIPATPSTVVDVTGAGDAYAAGLLAALLEGVPDAAAGTRAAALAARAVSVVGARP